MNDLSRRTFTGNELFIYVLYVYFDNDTIAKIYLPRDLVTVLPNSDFIHVTNILYSYFIGQMKLPR